MNIPILGTFACSAGYTSATTGCFQHFAIDKDWLSAQMHCIRHGGYLAKYDDLAQQGIFGGKSLSWIGAVQAGANWDNLQWLDGSDASPYWATEEPSIMEVECVAADSSGDWFTVDCSQKIHFICREGTSPADKTRLSRATRYIRDRETGCPWNANVYARYSTDTGYCYAFYSSSADRTTTETYCSMLGGVVISVMSEEESKFLTARMTWSHQTFDGTWLNTSPPTYSYWFPGEPDEATACYGMYTADSGAWRDLDCTASMMVTCKLPMPEICSDDDYCVNGICINGACVCNNGWSASAIAKCTICTSSVACLYGACVAGVCSCTEPWTLDPISLTCSTVACTGNSDCGMGTCQTSVCVCDQDWLISDVTYTCDVFIGQPITIQATTIPIPTTRAESSTETPESCTGVTGKCARGSCVGGSCVCDAGWEVDVNGACAACLNDGVCVHGKCISASCDCSDTNWNFNHKTRDCTSGSRSIVRKQHYRSGQFELVPGGALTGHASLLGLQANGLVSCAHACLKHSGCYSFNYDVDVCDLYGDVYDEEDIVVQGSMVYYRVSI
ncbi:uncharacterized protein LOC144352397 [Saccoglossus kowalevskii]